MDQEIQRLIIDAESKATEILTGKRHALDALAETLNNTTYYSGGHSDYCRHPPCCPHHCRGSGSHSPPGGISTQRIM